MEVITNDEELDEAERVIYRLKSEIHNYNTGFCRMCAVMNIISLYCSMCDYCCYYGDNICGCTIPLDGLK
jgi:hypothetical protein